MISIISLLLILISQLHATTDTVCNQPPPSTGFCKASLVTKYYYDKSTDRCTHFVYAGCDTGVNQNRFDTLEQCQNRCVKKASICELEPNVGPCRAINNRYFFNKLTNNCELFIYGGCNGNANNFANKADCMKTCL